MKPLFKLAMSILLCTTIFVGCTGKKEPTSVDSGQSNSPKPVEASKPIELTFYFPVAVGGPVTKIVEKMCEDFTLKNPTIKVNPVYTGSYGETMIKTQTAIQAKNPPDLAALSSTELYTLLDMDAIIPLDDLIAKDGGDEYKEDFFPAFMENAITGGKVYSIPFQRSTQILYYNKDAFREVGLDPEKPPTNYDELVDYAKKLTKEGRWGIEIPSTGFTHWLFQSFAIQNGKNVMSSDGKEVYFDTPENVKALQFWVDLSKKHQVMPEGTIEWGTAPTDFINGTAAMIYHTTGNLARIKNEVEFEFGTAFLPAGKNYGTPVGGGNLYIMKGISEEKQEAAWKLIRYLTEPEVTGQFSIDTGYVAARKSSYDTEALKKYIADFPQAAVARDHLKHAQASISTHNNGQVQKIFEDNLQAAITGKATPEEALKKAQQEAEKVLAPFNK